MNEYSNEVLSVSTGYKMKQGSWVIVSSRNTTKLAKRNFTQPAICLARRCIEQVHFACACQFVFNCSPFFSVFLLTFWCVSTSSPILLLPISWPLLIPPPLRFLLLASSLRRASSDPEVRLRGLCCASREQAPLQPLTTEGYHEA